VPPAPAGVEKRGDEATNQDSHGENSTERGGGYGDFHVSIKGSGQTWWPNAVPKRLNTAKTSKRTIRSRPFTKLTKDHGNQNIAKVKAGNKCERVNTSAQRKDLGRKKSPPKLHPTISRQSRGENVNREARKLEGVGDSKNFKSGLTSMV